MPATTPTEAGNLPATVSPELYESLRRCALAATPRGTDGGMYRRLLAGSADLRFIDHPLDADARDGEHTLDGIPLGCGREIERAGLQRVQDPAHVVANGLLGGIMGQKQRDGDFQGEKAAGDLVVQVVDDGVVQSVSPAGESSGGPARVGAAEPHATRAEEARRDHRAIPTVAGVSAFTVPDRLRPVLAHLAPEPFFRFGDGWYSLDRSKFVSRDAVTRLVQRNLCKVTRGRDPLEMDRADLTDLGREIAGIVSGFTREAGR